MSANLGEDSARLHRSTNQEEEEIAVHLFRGHYTSDSFKGGGQHTGSDPQRVVRRQRPTGGKSGEVADTRANVLLDRGPSLGGEPRIGQQPQPRVEIVKLQKRAGL